MMSRRSLIAAAGVPAAGLTAPARDPLTVDIALRHGAADEKATRAQLERLLAAHDLRPWLFTSRVMIDRTALPHSHPILTLHTRHLRDDDLLLSTWLHEQLHWFLSEMEASTTAAVEAVLTIWPDLPIGHPDGSSDAWGNGLHLLIGLLEWTALKLTLGELRARQVMGFWAEDHYRAIYRIVLDEPRRLAEVLRQHDLIWPSVASR
jgi:hypothetical protein